MTKSQITIHLEERRWQLPLDDKLSASFSSQPPRSIYAQKRLRPSRRMYDIDENMYRSIVDRRRRYNERLGSIPEVAWDPMSFIVFKSSGSDNEIVSVNTSNQKMRIQYGQVASVMFLLLRLRFPIAS